MNSFAARPLVYLISDGSLINEDFRSSHVKLLSLIELAVSARIPLIQIREKRLSARNLSELVSSAAQLTRGSKTKLLVNDRADIAATAGADGVHLTSTSVPAEAVWRSFPRGLLIGVSTHSIDETHKASVSGADLAVFGPVFETPGKGPAVGLDALHETVERVAPFHVLAIGGINDTNYRRVLGTGAAGFAAIRFLHNADNLNKLSKEFAY